MKIIVQPVKGSYKLLFYDGKHVHGIGIVEMTDTAKGPRPVKYRLRWGSRKEYRATPSKDLIAQLREGDVRMVKPDPLFEEFLHAFQIRTGAVDVCRICLLDDRYTPLTNDNFVIFGKSEKICLECGRRESGANWRRSGTWERIRSGTSRNCLKRPGTSTGCSRSSSRKNSR